MHFTACSSMVHALVIAMSLATVAPWIGRRRAVLGPIAVTVAQTGISRAANAAGDKFLPVPVLPDGATDLTFVISGSAGPDTYSQTIVDELKRTGLVVPLDWRTNRRGDSWSIFISALSAGENGRTFGAAVGRAVGSRQPKSVHVIAISAGAFAADALVVSLRRAWCDGGAPCHPYSHMTSTVTESVSARLP